MKTLLFGTLAALGIFSSPLLSASVVISDNFDSYAEQRMTNSDPWPTAIPGYTDLYWNTKAHKVFTATEPDLSIVAGTSLGRSGNVVAAVSTNSRKAGMTLELPTAITNQVGSSDWTISVDFYVGSVANATGSTLWLFSAYQDTVDNNGMAFGVDYVYSSDSASTIRIRNSTTSTNATLYTSAATGQWYTLTISGNNQEGGTASYILSSNGTELASKEDLPWVSNLGTHTLINRLVIGGGNDANIASTVYFDNFAFTAVPEASSVAYLLLGSIAFLAGRARFFPRGGAR